MALDPRQARGAYQPTPRASKPAGAEAGPVSGATAAEMAQTRFGGPTRVQSTPVTFTATWTQVLGANPRRVFWTMINRGVVNAAVDIDPSGSFATGVLMGAAGGFASMDVQEDGESVGWSVFGAAESATAVVRILEVMRV